MNHAQRRHSAPPGDGKGAGMASILCDRGDSHSRAGDGVDCFCAYILNGVGSELRVGLADHFSAAPSYPAAQIQ